MDNTKFIINEYSTNHHNLVDFCTHIKILIEELLFEEGIRIHSITARVKEKNSLEKKINDATKTKYQKLSDVTDIVGVRIVSYYEDEVDQIAKVIENEFEIDPENSIDKRKMIDPDRFGYLSLHYIAMMNNKRLALQEYRRFKDYKVEIQIRSILQHTWAEIEHDLGYKSKEAIPRDIRRSFSRLAGILELADFEFTRIRNVVTEYEYELEENINKIPAQILIDKNSVKAFLENNEINIELNRQISNNSSSNIRELSDLDIEKTVMQLSLLGFNNLGEVNNSMIENSRQIIEFANLNMTCVYEYLPPRIALFYLGYVLVTRSGSSEIVKEYIEKMNIGNSDESVDEIVTTLLEIYNEVAAKTGIQI